MSSLKRLGGCQITGTGSSLPGKPIANSELTKLPNFDGDAFAEKTGVKFRHYVASGVGTSDLCVDAAKKALSAAKLKTNQIDLVIVATITPDYLCPATAPIVQAKLGMESVAAYDINAACAGFVYALVSAAQFIKAGSAENALVIGADCLSRIISHEDESMTPLFGDGAGAVVLSRGSSEQGFRSYQLCSDGDKRNLLKRESGGALTPLCAGDQVDDSFYLAMEGRTVFKWAVTTLAQSITEVVEHARCEYFDLKWLFLHQANIRIIHGIANRLDFPLTKTPVAIDRHANTSAASIPLCLDEMFRAGKINSGEDIAMAGFGAGLSWASAVFRW